MAGGWEIGGPFPWPWRQVIDSEGVDQGSYTSTESIEQMLIDFDMTDAPLSDDAKLFGTILGYSIYDAGVFTGLRRVLPIRHPLSNRLWAAKIVSRRGRPNDNGKLGRKVRDAVSGMSYFRYNVQRLMIQFGCPPFTVLSDLQVSGLGLTREFYRYVEKTADFSVENITKRGSRFRWATVTPSAVGVGSGLPPGEALNNTLDFGIVLRTGKALLKWTWHQIPGLALFGIDGAKIPQNILGAIGKVNNKTFPDDVDGGFPKGTLLFLPPKFIPEDLPVEPIVAGVPPGYPPRVYKIEMLVSYFDPAVYPNWNGVGAANQYPHRGHNLQPAPAADAQPYFYLTTSNRNVVDSNAFLYQSYDFSKIFRLI